MLSEHGNSVELIFLFEKYSVKSDEERCVFIHVAQSFAVSSLLQVEDRPSCASRVPVRFEHPNVLDNLQ